MNALILDILTCHLASGDYKQVTRGGPKGAEWAGPCPVCGGDDRFRVWPEQEGGEATRKAGTLGGWWCRQCDNRGDLIELLIFARGLSFVEACGELKIELSADARVRRASRAPQRPRGWEPAEWPVPGDKWRAAAGKIALEASETLLGYEEGLKYLAGRGLPLAAAKQYGLGYLTGGGREEKGRYRPLSAFGLPNETNGGKERKVLWLPRGITIPLWSAAADEERSVWRLRIRRRACDLTLGAAKFMMLKGSSQAPMILPPSRLAADRAVWVIVEAELDAMAVHFACGGRVGVMAALTNRGKPDLAAHKMLKGAPRILVALDFDAAKENGERPGFQGWSWWEKNYRQSKRWPVPMGKDPGEAASLGVDLARWVEDALPKRLLPSYAGKPGDREIELPGPRGEAPPAEETETIKPCRHKLSTFEYILDGWDGIRKIYPICYLDKPDGDLTELNVCEFCPSQPAGLRQIIRRGRANAETAS